MLTPLLREALFGDLPLSDWIANAAPDAGDPMRFFAVAHQSLANGDRTLAIASLRAVVAMPNLDSRQYVEAWNILRSLGIDPEEANAKTLYGVVIEVSIASGVDTLSGYDDGSARYFNHAGSGIVFEAAVPEVQEPIRVLLAAATVVVRKIGPWNQPLPPPPTGGRARISMLTPSGLHFGEAPFDALSRDPMAAPVLDAGVHLMKVMIEMNR